MKEALEDIIQSYFKMNESIAGYIDALNVFICDLSKWLTSRSDSADVTTVSAVKAMHNCATQSSNALSKGKNTHADVVAVKSTLESFPQGLRRLIRTAPMPMVMNQIMLILKCLVYI